jgi:hypothetical protein
MFSFNRRRKQVRMWSTIGCIIDLTNPDLRAPLSNARAFERFNRSIPVVVAPWEEGRPVTRDARTCMTKDICEQGIGVILPQPLIMDQVFLGLWPPASRRIAGGNRPTFVVGHIRHCARAGGGFWQLGIELTQIVEQMDTSDFPCLVSRAAQLLPHSHDVFRNDSPNGLRALLG